MIAVLLGVAGAVYGMNRSSLPPFPDAVAYEGASLTQATKWERDQTAAAVYVPAGEAVQVASLQLGIISSQKYPTAPALLEWIQEQSKLSTTPLRVHDSVNGNERCLAGLSPIRSFMAIQLCKTGDALAACIESDRRVDQYDLGNCVNKTGCMAAMCERKWLEERDNLDRTLTTFLTP